ncbi:MAG: TetR/AcrR family transcriptional regulator [Bacteroidales bacterium]|jgi:AcrR family transcriptional regulator|nr:TetR/AcrR family transcriptional regulator [Bacteroidales bacterium]
MSNNHYIEDGSIDVESKILEAATSVFIHKGLAGTSMQEIADEAHISRTSLHYYYRNKDKLFDAVFGQVVDSFATNLTGIINADIALSMKLERFVDAYLDFMLENPNYVSFLVHDLNATPERLVRLILAKDLDIEKLKNQITSEMKSFQREGFDVAQFWASVIGMCIMPFVFKPMITKFFLNESEDAFSEFIRSRKQHILDFLMKYIQN